MTKIKTYVTAVFTAIVLALLCLVPVFKSAAFADDDPIEPNRPENYEELYYFSDNVKCVNRFNGYSLNYFGDDITGHLINWSCNGNKDNSFTCVTEYFQGENIFGNISNSLIIFELTNDDTLRYLLGYPLDKDDDEEGEGYSGFGSDENNSIYNLFKDWYKQKGCKIMFITDVEEAVFMTRNSFLNFVDIHINTNLFINFLANLFFRIDEENVHDRNHYSELDNCTFIFDTSLSENVESHFGEELPTHWFFDGYIVPYLKEIYFAELQQAEYEFYPVLKDKRIEFLFYLGNNTFFDAVECSTFNISDDVFKLDSYMSNDKVFAVGTSWYGQVDLNHFINLIGDFARYNNSNLEYFIFNEDGYNLNIGSKYKLFVGGGDLEDFEDLLPPIVNNFISGSDLTRYNNWTGLCRVTYKPVTFSEDGWFIDFGWDEDNYPDFWSWQENYDDNYDWYWKR